MRPYLSGLKKSFQILLYPGFQIRIGVSIIKATRGNSSVLTIFLLLFRIRVIIYRRDSSAEIIILGKCLP